MKNPLPEILQKKPIRHKFHCSLAHVVSIILFSCFLRISGLIHYFLQSLSLHLGVCNKSMTKLIQSMGQTNTVFNIFTFYSLLFCTFLEHIFPANLSNDPGKKGSNFFCCGAIRFPHIEMFSFLRRECINLQKGCLRKKMYLNSTFKGCIFVLKHFDQSQELQTMAKKCSQFYMIRTYDFCVT